MILANSLLRLTSHRETEIPRTTDISSFMRLTKRWLTSVLGHTSHTTTPCSDGSKGPGGSAPAARLPVHHLHSGHHQKRPSQTHHSPGAAAPRRCGCCQSAAQRWSPGRQLSSVPEGDLAHRAALWCGGVLSPTGHRSRHLPGRKKIAEFWVANGLIIIRPLNWRQ